MYIGAWIDKESGKLWVQFDENLCDVPAYSENGGWAEDSINTVVGAVYLSIRKARRNHHEPMPTDEQAERLREAITGTIEDFFK